MSGPRFLGAGIAATLVLSLGAGGDVFPPELAPRLIKAPLALPNAPQMIADTEAGQAPDKDGTGAGGGLSGPAAQGPSAKQRQKELARQARDNPAPRPPTVPGVSDDDINKIRDDIEGSAPVVEGVNGAPSGD